MTWVNQYLQQLKLPMKDPALNYLKQLIKANRRVFPFENVSKLVFDQYKKKCFLSVEEFLQRSQTYDTGGTCYTLNIQFARLLRAIGYTVSFIMPGGDHLALLVQIGKGRTTWYVDVGTTAPMLAPVPLTDDERQTPIFAGEKVTLKQGSLPGEYAYIRTIGGRQVHKQWAFKANVQYTLDDLIVPIQRSFQTDAPYMNHLQLDKWCSSKQQVISLRNRKLTLRSKNGSKTERLLKTEMEFKAVMRTTFQLPQLPVEQALEELKKREVWIWDQVSTTSLISDVK